MNWILRGLVSVVIGVVCGKLADTFAGACPAAPTDWLCLQWPMISGIGGSVLAFLGYPRAKAVATKASVIRSASTEAPSSEPERVEVVLTPIDVLSLEEQAEIEKNRGPG